MTTEFDRVRSALWSSAPGRVLTSVSDGVVAAWRTSAAAGAARSIHGRARSTPQLAVRVIAAAVAVAALMQPLIIALMPLTVTPAIPRLAYVAVAIIAAAVAWRADAIVAAWPTSHFARLRR